MATPEFAVTGWTPACAVAVLTSVVVGLVARRLAARARAHGAALASRRAEIAAVVSSLVALSAGVAATLEVALRSRQPFVVLVAAIGVMAVTGYVTTLTRHELRVHRILTHRVPVAVQSEPVHRSPVGSSVGL